MILRPLAWLFSASMLLSAGCLSVPTPGATYIVVRHAEKASADPRDPALSDAGRSRAEALAAQLHDLPVDAAYATGYRRTQQTTAPAARTHGLVVRTYDAKLPAAAFVARLRRDHPSGTVLVVGHSNTVPGIVAALCACAVASIDEGTYGGRYDVRIAGDGRATLEQGTY